MIDPVVRWRLLLGSSIVADFVDGVRFVAFPVLGVSLGASDLEVTLLAAAYYLPTLVFAPVIGPLLDLVSRASAVRVGLVGRIFVMAALAYLSMSHQVQVNWLLVSAFVYGAFEAVSDPAMHALVPEVVEQTRLVSANSHLSSGRVFAEVFAGRALGSVAFAAGISLGFAALAVLGLVATLLMAAVRSPPRTQGSGTSVRQYFGMIRDGYRFVVKDPLMSRMAPLVAVWAGVGGACWAIAPLWAMVTLELSTQDYALLLAISAVGSLAGTFAAPAVLRLVRGFRVGCASLLVGSLSMGMLSLVREIWSAGLLMAVNAFSIMIWNVLSSSVRQMKVPRELMGRTAVAYRTLVTLSLPIGAVIAGLVAEAWATTSVFVAGAILLVAAGVVLLPRLRTEMELPT